jgi:hypothetical protein
MEAMYLPLVALPVPPKWPMLLGWSRHSCAWWIGTGCQCAQVTCKMEMKNRAHLGGFARRELIH